MGLATVLGGLIGGQILKKVLKPKAKAPAQQQQLLPQPTAQLRPNSGAADALARRRGSLANRRTGAGGAEAGPGGLKTRLGQ